MEEQISNPTVGKIVSFLIGIAVIWMLIKAIQKNLFKKLRTIIIAKSSVVSLVIFLTIILFNSCFR
jgi:presenilin-like A22 family membrane protease